MNYVFPLVQVVIDAFRLINQQLLMMGQVPLCYNEMLLNSALGSQAPRQTTSNVGHLRKPAIAVLPTNKQILIDW